MLITSFFTDILKQIDTKYLNNYQPSEYELFRAINIYELPTYYQLWHKKANKHEIIENFFTDITRTSDEFRKLIKKEQYPVDRLLLFYAYLAYYVLYSSGYNLTMLENSMLKALRATKKSQLKRFTRGYFKLTIPEIDFLNLLIRKIAYYPGSEALFEKANSKAYYYNRYLNKKKGFVKRCLLINTDKEILVDILNNSTYNDFTRIYSELLTKAVNLIDAANVSIFYDKKQAFLEQLEAIQNQLIRGINSLNDVKEKLIFKAKQTLHK